MRRRSATLPCVALLIDVDDAADPRLDDFRDLTTADRRPDRPGGRGLVIAEGTVVVRRLLDSPYPVRALLGVPKRIAELADDLATVNAPAYVTSAQIMSDVVGFHLNRGVLAVADRAPKPTFDEVVANARVLAVLEGVNDHGTWVRCSATPPRRCGRRAAGGVVRGPAVPQERAGVDGTRPTSALHDRRTVAVRARRTTKVRISPRGSHSTLRSGNVAQRARGGLREDRVAVRLGGHGLSQAALDAADSWVRIPMASGVDSLNVATAAAVAFYELTR